MHAHRTRATVAQDGSVTVRDLPFSQGEAVEIIVLSSPGAPDPPASLQGSVCAYDRPFDPAADADEWEAT